MSQRSEVAPATLSVELTEGGIIVEYLDGREVFYRSVPEKQENSIRAPPGKDVHVLVTDEAGTEGAMFYVNDRKTDDAILADSGVGRVLLAREETTQLFPGVEVTREGHAHFVSADPGVVEGRIFVFIEDQFGETAYELVDGNADGAA